MFDYHSFIYTDKRNIMEVVEQKTIEELKEKQSLIIKN